MRPILWACGAWLVLASGSGAVMWAARTPIMHPPPATTPSGPPVRAPLATPAYPADSLGAAVVTRDVLRSERRPAPVPYEPLRITAGPLGPPALAPKPALLLKGIVWGAVPEAVLEGIPGADGPRVLRVGETIAGLRVQRIEVHRVTIVGMDTTWTLTLRYPWR